MIFLIILQEVNEKKKIFYNQSDFVPESKEIIYLYLPNEQEGEQSIPYPNNTKSNIVYFVTFKGKISLVFEFFDIFAKIVDTKCDEIDISDDNLTNFSVNNNSQ